MFVPLSLLNFILYYSPYLKPSIVIQEKNFYSYMYLPLNRKGSAVPHNCDYLLAQIDLRFRFRNYQRATWPLAAWIEMQWLIFYNDTPLLFVGKGDSHLLQHIVTTKVDADHIPNTRFGSQVK